MAVDELKKIFSQDNDLASVALKWILMHTEVSCVIPGASRPDQIVSNLKAAGVPELTADQMEAVKQVYLQFIWPDLSKEKW